MTIEPEIISTPLPTVHTPNSHLPILVYRSVPAILECTKDNVKPATEMGEKNAWDYGGTFGTYWTPHFHTVTHEAYAITSGSSTICMGVGPLDDPRHGTVLRVKKGDMIVNPTGVMHASITASGSRTSSSDGDAGSAPDNDVVEEGEPYEYVGLYPRGSPKYDNNFGKVGPEETEKKGRVARNVPIPESDPVNGEGGPLTRIWKATEM